MSQYNFSDMYDEFESQVKTIYPDHLELDDNTFIENNNEMKLRKGFCVEWKEVSNSERTLNGRSASQTVVVTNTLANRGKLTDIEARKAAIKEILTDSAKLIEWIEDNPQLNDKAVLVKFVSHPGPELIFDREEKAYLMIQATYQLEWF